MTVEEIAELVATQLGVARALPEDLIIEDLGAESADLVNIIAAVEDKYRVSVDEAEVLDVRTVADLHELVRKRL